MTTPPFDWRATRISQYANSSRMMSAIESFADAMDQGANLDRFVALMLDVLTAEGYGLDVWGRIVVVSRTLAVAADFFGFEEGGTSYQPFNTAPFYSGVGGTQNYVLPDDAYRVLILAKALANITYGSIPGINSILQLLFPGRGPCYVVDNLDMTMTYTFGFTPTPVETAIIMTSNVLPRPTGVVVGYSVP